MPSRKKHPTAAVPSNIDLVEANAYFRELVAKLREAEKFAQKVRASISDAKWDIVDGMVQGRIPWTLEQRVTAAAGYLLTTCLEIDDPEWIDELTADNLDDLMGAWQETRRQGEVSV